MDKKVVGIPRSLFYYQDGHKLAMYLKELNVPYLISPRTNREILDLGIKLATDEMCLSIKNYLGHVAYLQDKCDYILVPRIDNYGLRNQTCTNFLSMYDIVKNLLSVPLLNYNINYQKKETEKRGYLKIGYELGKTKKECLDAYLVATIKNNKNIKIEKQLNYHKLSSKKVKILLVGHSYNVYDEYIGSPILKVLENLDCEILFSDKFDRELTNRKAYEYSNTIYWKYSKENIGAIKLCENTIDGVLFLSTFPCGLDSLVNELVMHKLTLPYLNLVVDDLDALAGMETRIESFIDILKERKTKYA